MCINGNLKAINFILMAKGVNKETYFFEMYFVKFLRFLLEVDEMSFNTVPASVCIRWLIWHTLKLVIFANGSLNISMCCSST